MKEYSACVLREDTDAEAFSRILWQRGISHRIDQDSTVRTLLVSNKSHIQLATALYQHYLAGNIEPPISKKDNDSGAGGGISLKLLSTPMTTLLLLLSVIGFLIATFDKQGLLIRWLAFYDLSFADGEVVFSIPNAQYWRLISPVFLHFGPLHIVFNGLWLWELGRRLELAFGSRYVFGLFLLTALASNIAQVLFGNLGVFGGMSGVIYAFLGFCWCYQKLSPRQELAIPQSIFVVMTVWLLFCKFAGEAFGLSVANAAHTGGLLIGLLLGLLAGFIARKGRV